jgi:hypothetical protein
MEEAINILYKQIELLTDWNKKNIKIEPEQVRKNIETILLIVRTINELN